MPATRPGSGIWADNMNPILGPQMSCMPCIYRHMLFTVTEIEYNFVTVELYKFRD